MGDAHLWHLHLGQRPLCGLCVARRPGGEVVQQSFDLCVYLREFRAHIGREQTGEGVCESTQGTATCTPAAYTS